MSRAAPAGGQASVEMVAGAGILLLAGLVALQLLAAGHSHGLAEGAAEAGALAGAAGEPVKAAVRAALPPWARSRTRVERHGGRVRVDLRPPALIGAMADRLEVSASAWARRPRGDER